MRGDRKLPSVCWAMLRVVAGSERDRLREAPIRKVASGNLVFGTSGFDPKGLALDQGFGLWDVGYGA